MEISQIKETYNEILKLKEEQPNSSLILKSIIHLKELVDNSIINVFQDLYWEHWEETAAYKEISSQHWLEILENRLLKKELWVDTSIAQLLLSIPGELSQILQNKWEKINKEELEPAIEWEDKIIIPENNNEEPKNEKEDEKEIDNEVSEPDIDDWKDIILEDDWGPINQHTHLDDSYPVTPIFQAHWLGKVPSKEELDAVWEKIEKNLEEKNNNYSSINSLINKSEESIYQSIDMMYSRLIILSQLENQPDIKKAVLTSKELNNWDWSSNPLFLKSDIFNHFIWGDINNQTKGLLYLKDIVDYFDIKFSEDEKYWWYYEKVLIELFWTERLRKEREALKEEIKWALEEKFKENPEYEYYWYFEGVDSLGKEEISSILSVKIDKNLLWAHDISRWIGKPVDENEKVSLNALLNEIYWKKEVLLRKEKLKEKKYFEEYAEKYDLLDFGGNEEEIEGFTQLSFDFVDQETWNTFEFHTSLWASDDRYEWLATYNIFEVFFEKVKVESEKEFNEKYQDNREWIQNFFDQSAVDAAKHMLDYYWDMRNWIGENNKETIINLYRERYPHADKQLDSIFSDDKFLETVEKKYLDNVYEFADNLFMSNDLYENETMTSFCWSLLDITCNEIFLGDYIGLYFYEIENLYKKSEEKYKKGIAKEDKTSQKKSDKERAEDLWISLEKYKLIQKFLDSLSNNLAPKKKKKETAKLAELIKNHEALNVTNFCKQHDIKEFSEKSLNLLYKLWIQLSLSKSSKTNTQVKETSSTPTKKVEKTTAPSTQEKEEIDPEEIERIKADIPEAFIRYAGLNWFWVLNEKLIKKEITEYISVPQNREYLAEAILDKSFWHLKKKKDGVKRKKPQMKNKSDIYSIEAHSWEWRFIVLKVGDSFFITDFMWHRTYDKILRWKKK